MTGTAIITMAGLGSRFRKAGFEIPKYRIDAHGRSLFDWSMLSLNRFRDAGWSYVFLMRQEDEATRWVRARCEALGIPNPIFVELDDLTDGQATTALLAGPKIHDVDAPMLVYNIDTFVCPNALDPGAVRGHGWVPCAELPGNAWSFAAAGPDLRATELREKKRISNHATIGLYYFSSFASFSQTYDAHFASSGGIEAGERYIAPMYNTLIAQNRDVFVEVVAAQDFYALGTPEDVGRFTSGPRPTCV